MASTEDKLWQEIVAPSLPRGEQDSLSKSSQEALATSLQDWVAHCISAHIEELMGKSLKEIGWEIDSRGKTFLGAVRWQEVDVSIADAQSGLVLAVDPKHFQSKDSLQKNWKNGHNDLVAFATNLHERFPLCAVGGVLVFPQWTASEKVLQQMYGICSRSIPREKGTNADGKFEGFGLCVYDTEGKLIWPFPAQESPLRPQGAFLSLAERVCARTLAIT